MSAPKTTTKAENTEPPDDDAQTAPDTEAVEHDDNLGDDRLAEMARPYLDENDPGELEVHHGPPPADTPADGPAETPAEDSAEPDDMTDMRLGRSIFAELAREAGSVFDRPQLPPPPAYISGPDGLHVEFDQASTANLDGFVADKAELADWMRTARANTYGSESAAA